MTYYLYILECVDQSLYSGITTDLVRRLWEHNTSPRGARYTRAHRPCKLVYSREFPDRSRATKAEYELKKLSHEEKKLKLLGS
ncbi:MAG: GIY-YIG nuclease family protein [bacterium]